MADAVLHQEISCIAEKISRLQHGKSLASDAIRNLAMACTGVSSNSIALLVSLHHRY